MTSNTFKTTMGFLATILRKHARLKSGNDSLESVFNYLPISENITTSGQPTEAQFFAIRKAGFKAVINLAPHSAENAIKDESAVLNRLGIRYTHIPVNFKNPTDADFAKFADAMKNASAEKMWVHCAANMRVSAFMYRYRRDILKEDAATAKRDLDKIWEPYGVWKKFLAM
jgi:protein tyrosine phosphatase (PTP) superfamily phosphohydrolase (DUF442 family)